MQPSDLNLTDEKQISDIEQKLKETKAKLEQFIKKYPLASVAGALGLGYVVARLLEKSRRQ
jgi:hypothetical protein